MKLLISGFEPFSHYQINSSQVLINKMSELKSPISLEKIILPVSFKNSFSLLKKKIEQFTPDYVLCFGLAESRLKISFEKIAINYMDARIPDNDGFQPKATKITDGPDGIFTTLDLDKIATKFQNEDFEISYSAGTYVCNYLMYQVLLYSQNKNFKTGFIHLPPLNSSYTEEKMLKQFALLISAL